MLRPLAASASALAARRARAGAGQPRRHGGRGRGARARCTKSVFSANCTHTLTLNTRLSTKGKIELTPHPHTPVASPAKPSGDFHKRQKQKESTFGPSERE
eukprot:scaffold91667_cov63-Phaeocystis_antarctica.AAC.3